LQQKSTSDVAKLKTHRKMISLTHKETFPHTKASTEQKNYTLKINFLRNYLRHT